MSFQSSYSSFGARARFAPRTLLLTLLLIGFAAPLPAQEALTEDQSTPRSATRMFIDACRAGEYELAARVLDTRGLNRELARDREELARRLKFVLDQKVWIDYAQISDDPAGADKSGEEILHTLAVDGRELHISLTKRGGKWRFSRSVVERVPALYAEYGPGPLEDYLPRPLWTLSFWEIRAWQWIGLILNVVIGFFIAMLIHAAGVPLVRAIVKRTSVEWDDQLFKVTRGPARLLLTVLITWALLLPLRLSVPAQSAANSILLSLAVIAFVRFGLRFADIVASELLKALTKDVSDELKQRGVRTQVYVLRRVAKIILTILGVSLVLLQFEDVRRVGVSLLASAGIAGLVIGLAAQKSIGSLLAGIQLALTQPVRIGDTVIVEGEWGQVEEINLTYIVVKIWDLRRLVVPISRFLEQPFQNWTKVSPDLLGTIYFYADYTAPVERLRGLLETFVKERQDWDGNTVGLIVVDCTDRVMTLRALISAKDATDQWNLRCAVREHMVKTLQEMDGGAYLPRERWQETDAR